MGVCIYVELESVLSCTHIRMRSCSNVYVCICRVRSCSNVCVYICRVGRCSVVNVCMREDVIT